jgi:hypothetical protein
MISKFPEQNSRKMIDTFIFFNEIEMLKARLEYLGPYVDYFVISEANTCFDSSKKDFVLTNKIIKNLPFLLSDTVGFMRPNNREKVGFVPKDNSWGNHPCDNGVIAQWYADKEKMVDKFSFALNKKLGITNEMGLFGIVVDDLIIHMVFGWGEEWIQDLQKTLGNEYLEIREELKKKPIDNEVIENLVSKCIDHNHPRQLNNDPVPEEMNEFIDNIKKEL